MDAQQEKHIEKVAHALTQWFDSKNTGLSRAIEQAVDEKLFSFEDIKHQILALKHTISESTLKKWVSDSGAEEIPPTNKRVLCLHAGNLPMVGIQDLIAVLLRKGKYTGKLSRKDPYLMDSLLRHLCDLELVKPGNWSVTLDELPSGISDALIFAGSKTSAGPVKDRLSELGFISEDTPSLMRISSFSIAFIDDESPETMRDLTEAVFRYGGAGCRSVAVVVSPYRLRNVQCGFTDYIESFWLKNPPDYDIQESVKHRFAMNKAVDIDQAWLEHFLIEESTDVSPEKHIAYWIPGDVTTVTNLVEKAGSDLQSVYSTVRYLGQKIGDKVVEPLSLAQKPHIWWEPDNINTLVWLKKHGI